MDQKILAIIAVAIVAAAGVGGALVLMNSDDDSSSDQTGSETTFTDGVGRTVAVPDNLDKGIVTFGGGGPLRFLSIFGVEDKVIEVDRGDVLDPKNGRGYSYAFDYTGKNYHGDNKLDNESVERIGAVLQPSLVIMQESVYRNYEDMAKTMEKAPGVTLMVLKNQSMTEFFDENGKIADYYRDNVEMIGKALKMQDRAAEHLEAVENIYKDIQTLVGSNPGTTYVAGVTISGSNEWTTTFPTYMPLKITKGNNAYTGPVTANRVDMNPEDAMNYVKTADRIIIDPSSSDKMSTVNSQLLMSGIYEINNDSDPNNDIDLFVTYPIVWDSINYDTVLAGCYYLLSLQYGSLTRDQVKEKVVDVFEAFYGDAGTKVPIHMGDFFLGKSNANGVQLPMLQPVKIVQKGDVYTTVILE